MGLDVDLRGAFQRALKRQGRARFQIRWLELGRWGGIGVCLAVLCARIMGWPQLPWLLPSWGFLVVIAALVALPARRLRPRERRRVAQRLDQDLGAHGAVVAATWLMESEAQPRFSPLIQKRAGDALAAAPRPLPTLTQRPSPRVVASLLLLFAVSLRFSSNRAATPVGARSAAEESGAAETSPKPPRHLRGREDSEESRPELADLVRIEISTLRKIYLLNESIIAKIRVVPLGRLDEDLRLDLRFGVSNGLPSPDQGLGSSFHVIPDPGTWVIPKEAKKAFERELRLDVAMKRWKIHDLGLFTIAAAALAVSEEDARGGVLAPRKVFQISANRERQRVSRPQPTAKAKAPRKKQKERSKEKKRTPRGGGKPPELGKREKLPKVKLRPEAVKPLVVRGRTRVKEVNVFDREKRDQAPSPQPKRIRKSSPEAAFQRRREEAIRRLRLTPSEARLVRRFFEGDGR